MWSSEEEFESLVKDSKEIYLGYIDSNESAIDNPYICVEVYHRECLY